MKCYQIPKMDKNLVEAVNGKEVTNKKEFFMERGLPMASRLQSGGDPRLLTKVFSNRKGGAAT
jgi:hypothetical protein